MNVTRFLFFSFQHFLFYKFLQITVKLEDEHEISKYERLKDMLDECDDVQEIYHNIVFDEE